ncbi:MAG: energy transducer TonB [Helicobacteraceae bacterium]|nr:energy transducer TonB [Helicobacteraceae bacterium]
MLKERLKNATPFLLSVGIHSTLVAATLLMAQDNETPMAQESRVILSLSNYTVVKQEPKPQQIQKNTPKKEEPKKTIKKEIKKEVVQKKQTTPQQTVQKKEIVPPAEAFAPQKSNEVAPVEEIQEISRAPKQEKTVTKAVQQATAKQNSPQIDPTTLGQIRFMIQNSLVYPAMARRLKIEGVVLVHFILTRDGRVKSALIEQKSGSTSLDSKALETVLGLSGEYPKLPKEMQLKIPIAFSLKHS